MEVTSKKTMEEFKVMNLIENLDNKTENLVPESAEAAIPPTTIETIETESTSRATEKDNLTENTIDDKLLLTKSNEEKQIKDLETTAINKIDNVTPPVTDEEMLITPIISVDHPSFKDINKPINEEVDADISNAVITKDNEEKPDTDCQSAGVANFDSKEGINTSEIRLNFKEKELTDEIILNESTEKVPIVKLDESHLDVEDGNKVAEEINISDLKNVDEKVDKVEVLDVSYSEMLVDANVDEEDEEEQEEENDDDDEENEEDDEEEGDDENVANEIMQDGDDSKVDLCLETIELDEDDIEEENEEPVCHNDNIDDDEEVEDEEEEEEYDAIEEDEEVIDDEEEDGVEEEEEDDDDDDDYSLNDIIQKIKMDVNDDRSNYKIENIDMTNDEVEEIDQDNGDDDDEVHETENRLKEPNVGNWLRMHVMEENEQQNNVDIDGKISTGMTTIDTDLPTKAQISKIMSPTIIDNNDKENPNIITDDGKDIVKVAKETTVVSEKNKNDNAIKATVATTTTTTDEESNVTKVLNLNNDEEVIIKKSLNVDCNNVDDEYDDELVIKDEILDEKSTLISKEMFKRKTTDDKTITDDSGGDSFNNNNSSNNDELIITNDKSLISDLLTTEISEINDVKSTSICANNINKTKEINIKSKNNSNNNNNNNDNVVTKLLLLNNINDNDKNNNNNNTNDDNKLNKINDEIDNYLITNVDSPNTSINTNNKNNNINVNQLSDNNNVEMEIDLSEKNDNKILLNEEKLLTIKTEINKDIDDIIMTDKDNNNTKNKINNTKTDINKLTRKTTIKRKRSTSSLSSVDEQLSRKLTRNELDATKTSTTDNKTNDDDNDNDIMPPTKKLCLELEKDFLKHDKLLTDYINITTGTTTTSAQQILPNNNNNNNTTNCNNIDDIQNNIDIILNEIQQLNTMIVTKELEWNTMLHLKKVKEEILIRLQRRKNIMEIITSKLNNNNNNTSSGTSASSNADQNNILLKSTTAQEQQLLQQQQQQLHIITLANQQQQQQAQSQNQQQEQQSVGLINKTQTILNNRANMKSSDLAKEKQNTERLQRNILPKPSNNNAITSPSYLTADLLNGHHQQQQHHNLQQHLNNTNNQQPMGRQGAIKDVKSIIADYRQRHPEIVPRRGRRMKSLLNCNNDNLSSNRLNSSQSSSSSRANIESKIKELGILLSSVDGNSRPSSADSSHSNSNQQGTNGNQQMSTAASILNQAQQQQQQQQSNVSFKDVLVQFAKMSQSTVDRQLPTTSTPSSASNFLSALNMSSIGSGNTSSSTSSSMTPTVTGTNKLQQPYPEVTLHPVTAQSDSIALGANSAAGHSSSLLHGILTKQTATRPSATAVGFSSTFSPTLARLLTAPERITPHVTHNYQQQQQQQQPTTTTLPAGINLSKSHSEITITPVINSQQQQQQQQASLAQKLQYLRADSLTNQSRNTQKQDNNAAFINMFDEADDSVDRLVIDESDSAGTDQQQNQQQQQQQQQQQSSLLSSVTGVNASAASGGGASVASGKSNYAFYGQEFHENEVPECQGCKKREAQFVCAGCGNQWYCSRECQVSSWDEHSEVCTC